MIFLKAWKSFTLKCGGGGSKKKRWLKPENVTDWKGPGYQKYTDY